jgi:hypothetical protein
MRTIEIAPKLLFAGQTKYLRQERDMMQRYVSRSVSGKAAALDQRRPPLEYLITHPRDAICSSHAQHQHFYSRRSILTFGASRIIKMCIEAEKSARVECVSLLF